MLCLQLYFYFFIRKERFQRKSFLAGSSIKRNSSSLRQQTNNGSLCLASDYKECIVLFCNQLVPTFYRNQLVPTFFAINIFLQSTGPSFLSQSTGPNFFAINCSQLFLQLTSYNFFANNVKSVFTSIRPHFYCIAKDVQLQKFFSFKRSR